MDKLNGFISTHCPDISIPRPVQTLTFNCPVDQTGHATAACTTSQTVTIRNTAASGSASLTFSYNTYSTYGSVIIDTGSDRTIAQGGNKTYTPSFTLQSVLSTTTNAGTLTISSVDSNNSANRSDDSPQNINIQLVPAIIIPPTEEHHAPTIINLTATTNSITVQWTNPESYDGGVKIYLNTGGVNEHVEPTSKNKKCGSTSTSDDCTTPVVNTSTITGLNANTTYQVWVRGWLHSQQ